MAELEALSQVVCEATMDSDGRSDPKALFLWCLSMGEAVLWLGLTRAALKASHRGGVRPERCF